MRRVLAQLLAAVLVLAASAPSCSLMGLFDPISCATDADCEGYWDPSDDCISGLCDPTSHTCERSIRDADGDGHGDAACAGRGVALPADDCDDHDPSRYAGAPELCDGFDQDCSTVEDADGDGRVEEPLEDADGDGEVVPDVCEGGPLRIGDCDDANPVIHSAADEGCNEIDDNCNERIDEDCLPIASIDTNGRGFCAVRNGQGFCWGAFPDGQGGEIVSEHPIAIPEFQGVSGVLLPRLDQDGATEMSPCSFVENELVCLDQRHPPLAADGDITFRSLSLGPRHGCIHRNNNTATWEINDVICWGRGFLGNGVETIEPNHSGVVLRNLKDVTIGRDFTCAIRGVVGQPESPLCWGRNSEGQLGNGSLTDALAPVAISAGIQSRAAAGAAHVCLSTGHCWGRNTDGQVAPSGGGDFFATPRVAVAAGLGQITTGDRHSCFAYGEVGRPKQVVCWGNDDLGQLGGSGVMSGGVPRPIPTLRVVGVVAGGDTTCALTEGTALCWGALSPDGSVHTSIPTRIPDL